MNKKLLKLIKQQRILVGISGHELAQLTGLSPTTIYRIEDGNTPSAVACAIILEKLGVKIDTLRISDFLKNKMKKMKLPLQRLAGSTTISYGTLQKICAGETPSLKTCCKLAKELDMPLEDFIEWPDKKITKINTFQ